MSQHSIDAKEVRDHFDAIAPGYDNLKKKNWYYYLSLKKIVSKVIPQNARVLDIGTGTGEILNSLSPALGVGIDLSPSMIAIAKQKFPAIRFEAVSYKSFECSDRFDYILLVDVIEHLDSPQSLFQDLQKFCMRQTKIVLTMANPGWEWFLEILEKLKLKMEEGPHLRISEKELIAYAEKSGFKLTSEDSAVLLPMGLPVLANIFNDFLAKLPFFKKMNLIRLYVFQKN